MPHLSERELELPDAVIGQLLDIAAERHDIISLGPGEPDFALPKPLIDYTKKIAHKVNHYAPPGGFRALREAICRKLRKDNRIQAVPDNIIVTNGSQEALLIACMATLDVSEQILIPSPSFMSYLPAAELVDASPVFVELKEDEGFAVNPDSVKKAIEPKKTKVLVINSPANPTGTVLRRNVLEELAGLAVEHDLMIFSDEAYEKITYDDAKHLSIGSFSGMQDRVVSFYTFSKSYAMCGFRLGYAVGPKELISAMTRIHVDTTICAPTLSQLLGIKALSLNQQRYIGPMVREYDRRRRLIVARLNQMGLSTPTPRGAFYTFSNIRHLARDSRAFARELLQKAKVAVVPGSEFGRFGEGYIRCSYATDYKKIGQAADRMEKLVKKLSTKSAASRRSRS